MIVGSQIIRQPSKAQLLVLAAVVQLILTASVYTIGRLGFVQSIDQNGCASSLTPDSLWYLPEANSLSDVLTQTGPVTWLRTRANLHIRLYSLSLTVLRPLLGANILSALPVNLICYIAILWLTFKVGTEVFDRRTSLAATVAIALWPSFLLHSTQLLKDLIFVSALLTLVLIMTWWLTRKFSYLTGLATGITGGVASYVVSSTRSGFWLVILMAVVLTGAGLLVIRQIRNRQALWWNVTSAVLIIISTCAMFLWARERIIIIPPPNSQGDIQSLSVRANYVVRKISEIRQGFRPRNNSVGSEIDSDVEFSTTLDIVRYLPRTAEIGFLAPFPNRWFTTGQVSGRAGRLLSGIEMSLFYIIDILALIGLWRSRSNLRAWLLCLICVIGVGSLTLAVMNLGALYRLRYGFYILLVILGANGLMTSIEYLRGRSLAITGLKADC